MDDTLPAAIEATGREFDPAGIPEIGAVIEWCQPSPALTSWKRACPAGLASEGHLAAIGIVMGVAAARPKKALSRDMHAWPGDADADGYGAVEE
jgi:hypothetical protein